MSVLHRLVFLLDNYRIDLRFGKRVRESTTAEQREVFNILTFIKMNNGQPLRHLMVNERRNFDSTLSAEVYRFRYLYIKTNVFSFRLSRIVLGSMSSKRNFLRFFYFIDMRTSRY